MRGRKPQKHATKFKMMGWHTGTARKPLWYIENQKVGMANKESQKAPVSCCDPQENNSKEVSILRDAHTIMGRGKME